MRQKNENFVVNSKISACIEQFLLVSMIFLLASHINKYYLVRLRVFDLDYLYLFLAGLLVASFVFGRFLQYLICICDRIQILFVFVCFTARHRLME